MAIYDFFLSRNGSPSITADNYVGHVGRLFYDSANGIIKISDGVTPGGLSIPYTIASSSVVGGIKAGPGIVRQLDDQSTWSQIVLSFAVSTRVENRREEREIGFDPLAPRLRGIGLRLAAFPGRRLLRRFRREAGQGCAKQGEEKTVSTH